MGSSGFILWGKSLKSDSKGRVDKKGMPLCKAEESPFFSVTKGIFQTSKFLSILLTAILKFALSENLYMNKRVN
jgi:hypothetical protein